MRRVRIFVANRDTVALKKATFQEPAQQSCFYVCDHPSFRKRDAQAGSLFFYLFWRIPVANWPVFRRSVFYGVSIGHRMGSNIPYRIIF